ncbi:hypothetical protein OS493_012881 [Desmophyllum pertusum]|uniref:Uncharacterized protein n=1 Tax=Desmophyllum pertusum TaxID=174260 RepID=A0A9X0CRT6_9CNID|nr:hypothetical protein OS493_012881 [Desmophyllum pertusum]
MLSLHCWHQLRLNLRFKLLEAFWAWRNLKTEPINYFEALNASLKPLGYKISDDISTKIGIRLGVETRYLSSRIANEKNTKKKKAIRGSFLRKISIQEQDMAQIPEQLIRERELLKEQVSKLEQRLEEQADEVFQLLEAGIKQQSEIKILEEATQGLKNQGWREATILSTQSDATALNDTLKDLDDYREADTSISTDDEEEEVLCMEAEDSDSDAVVDVSE